MLSRWLLLPLLALACAAEHTDPETVDTDDELRVSLASPVRPSKNTGQAEAFLDQLHGSNGNPWGLAFRGDTAPSRLYVSDTVDARIYVYDVTKNLALDDQLRSRAFISTDTLHADFVKPRDLAYARIGRHPYLFAVTSNLRPNSTYRTNYLWRINLVTKAVTRKGLNPRAFGIRGREVMGLAYSKGELLISYDTNGFSSDVDKVRKGILKLRVASPSSRLDRWAHASATAHIPHAARLSRAGEDDPNGLAEGAVKPGSVKRCYGLAALPEHGYLWGTSMNKYIYLAESTHGRGVHSFSTGATHTRGLAYGRDLLWSVQKVDGTWGIRTIAVAMTNDAPIQSKRTVRHLRVQLDAEPRTRNQSLDGVVLDFMRPPSRFQRPRQHRDSESYEVRSDAPHTTKSKAYCPAGDCASRQKYFEVSLGGQASRTTSTHFELDFWTEQENLRVFPHRANALDLPNAGYLSDSYNVYRMSDVAAYGAFLTAVAGAMASEYPGPATLGNPYWTARDVLEFIWENYTYGNVANPLAFNPAANKLALATDSDADNNKMSCSSSAFAMAGALRALGVPARWVGTTRFRRSWDTDGDGFLDPGEEAKDETYHRWIEVWLGDNYGWQRFDPTPSSRGPFEASQWELMSRSIRQTSNTDLVMMVGNGQVSPFMHGNGNQLYNSMIHFDGAGGYQAWRDSQSFYRQAYWSNATQLEVGAPPATGYGPGSTVVPFSTSGRWDMDPNATVSLVARSMTTGVSTQVASGVAHASGAVAVDVCDVGNGTYQWVLRKDGDPLTGDRSAAFTVSGCP